MEHTPPSFETWESSTDEPGKSGLLTVYPGGRSGAQTFAAPKVVHGVCPEPLRSKAVGWIDDAVPGTAAHFNGFDGPSFAQVRYCVTATDVQIDRNRHEHPRRQSLASAGVADRHPILTHGLDGRRDIAVGIAQELLGLAGLVCRSEQRTALIVFTMNQDGQG